jgi:hypothetical protein
MQGLPDQLDEIDYVTVPRSEWRALLEEVATIRRLVAELAARLPAVDDLADEDAGGAKADDRQVPPPDEAGGAQNSYDRPESSATVARQGRQGRKDADTSSDSVGSAGAAEHVVLRPTVVRRDELGRSIRAYEVPLQSMRPPVRHRPAARSEATLVAGERTPSLDALRARVEQAAASQAADSKRSSRLARWTSWLSGHQSGSGTSS